MPDYTPETLRALFLRKGNTIWQDDALQGEGNAHADAWAADKQRLEAAERFHRAHDVVEDGISLYDLHKDAVMELREAHKALHPVALVAQEKKP